MSPVNVRGYKECVACGFVYCQFESTTDSARKMSEQTVNTEWAVGAWSV
jgi:Zn ribbon nucleic-acid-binding protein